MKNYYQGLNRASGNMISAMRRSNLAEEEKKKQKEKQKESSLQQLDQEIKQKQQQIQPKPQNQPQKQKNKESWNQQLKGYDYQQSKTRQQIRQLINNASSSRIYQQKIRKQSGYRVGSFSKFAHQTQTLLYKKKLKIDLVLRQAVLSYKQKIKQNDQAIKKLTNFDTLDNYLHEGLTTQQQINQYIKNPLLFQINYWTTITQNRNHTQWNQNQLHFIVAQMFRRRSYVRKLAVIDGKYVKINKLRTSQRFYMGQNLFLSTQTKNLYVKLKKNQKPVKVMLFQGNFYQKKQLQGLTQDMKKQILGMVILYLKHDQTILQKSQISDLAYSVTQLVNMIKKKGDVN